MVFHNGQPIPSDSLGFEDGECVQITHRHPVDDLEPLEEPECEQGPERAAEIKRAVLCWFVGSRDGSLSDIAQEFGVSRAITSRYARAISEKTGVPPPRSAETAARCREAQLARKPKKKAPLGGGASKRRTA